MRIIIYILAFTCGIAGCTKKVDNKAVLIIGKYKLTKEEFKQKRTEDRYKTLTDEGFQEKLVTEGRFLAFAIDHKYDTLPALKTLFKYASQSYASEVGGFVWNKKVKPKLRLTEKDIKNTYSKRSEEYVMQVILFSSADALKRYYNSSKDFNLVEDQASSDTSVKFFNAIIRFPYFPLSYYTTDLTDLKNGQIIGPVETENGYLFARVKATKPVAQKTYEQEKTNIQRDLLFGLTQRYLWENQRRILKKAIPKIYETAINELALKFDIQKKSWPGINPNLLLMKYSFGGKRVSYLISDFQEFVNNQPVFFGTLNKPADLKKILTTVIIERYLFAEAKQMHMEADNDYQRFSKDNREKIILEHFKRNYIYPRLSVSAQESKDYYQNNNRNFRTFQSISIIAFKFNNIRNAYQGRTQLEKKKSSIAPDAGNSSNSMMMSLPDAIKMDINANDENNDPKLLETALRLAPGQVSLPIKVNGKFLIVILTAKRGFTTMPYVYVKGKIHDLIYSQKEKQLTAKLAENLKEKYPTEKNQLKTCLLD